MVFYDAITRVILFCMWRTWRGLFWCGLGGRCLVWIHYGRKVLGWSLLPGRGSVCGVVEGAGLREADDHGLLLGGQGRDRRMPDRPVLCWRQSARVGGLHEL